MENDFMTTIEVVERLCISRVTLQYWIRDGKITAYQTGIGKTNLFKRADVEALLVPHPKPHQTAHAA